MGCTTQKEALEDQIMRMKLQRMSIQMEREKQLRYLSDIEGKQIVLNDLPAYLALNGRSIIINQSKDKTSAGNVDNNQINSISINRQEIENPLIHDHNNNLSNGGEDNQVIMEHETGKIRKVTRKKRRKSTKRSLQKEELANVAVNNNDI